MRFIDAIASYVPSLIAQHIVNDETLEIPHCTSFETVCLFFDISGFTALSEAMERTGLGPEGLQKHLNSYFSQMVRLIASEGGDVFKFAGDAAIVLWPPSDDISISVRRAAQCAYQVQKQLDEAKLQEGVSLSVKVGIGVGEVTVLHVGGVYNRVEYIAVGEPLLQAFAAEHHAIAGQVMCHPKIWSYLAKYFSAQETVADGFVLIDLTKEFKSVRKSKMVDFELADDQQIIKRIQGYVAGAALKFLNPEAPETEQWGNEIRSVCTLFVNLGLNSEQLIAAAKDKVALEKVHNVMEEVQKSVYTFQGAINKFLMDDKGSTLIACFGLPPLAHDDDAVRGVLAALRICEKLLDMGLIASIGVTVGNAFTGVVGSRGRREYSVLGDCVNLAARLMQKMCTEKGGVLCSGEVRRACGNAIIFKELKAINVKGKSNLIQIYQPYLLDCLEPCPEQDLIDQVNHYTLVHQRQLQNLAIYRSLGALQSHLIAQPTQKKDTLFRAASLAARIPGISQNQVGNILRTVSVNLDSPVDSPESVSVNSSPAKSCGSFGQRTSFRKSMTNNGLTPIKNTLNLTPPPSTFKSLRSLIGTREIYSNFDLDEIEVLCYSDFSVDQSQTLACSMTIELDQVSTFADLRDLAVSKVMQNSLKVFGSSNDTETQSNPQNDFSSFYLYIVGSRSLLPTDENIDIKWLGSFLAEAFRSYDNSGIFGSSISAKFYLTLAKESLIINVPNRQDVARFGLLKSKIKLISQNQGSCSFIEGEPGIGKSHLLGGFITKTLPSTTGIFSVSTNPHISGNPFSIWITIFQEFIDSQVSSKQISRREVLRQIFSNRPDLDTIVDLLFDILEFDSQSTHKDIISFKNIKDNSQIPFVRELFFTIIQEISKSQPTLIVIDDAIYLDEDSWSLVLASAVGKLGPYVDRDFSNPNPLSLMLVLAFRPFDKYRDSFMPISKSYLSLYKVSHVQLYKINGIPPEYVENYVEKIVRDRLASSLSVYLSDNMLDFLETNCKGNPLIIREYMDLLLSDEEYFVEFKDTDKQIITMNSKYEDIANLPIPLKINAFFTMFFDRLSSCQQMILKTASAVGHEFTRAMTKKVYPIKNHLGSFDREFDELQQLRVIVHKPTKSNDEDRFQFESEIFQQVVISHMLKNQKEKLYDSINRAKEDVKMDRMKDFIDSSQGSQKNLKSGTLTIRKQKNDLLNFLRTQFSKFGWRKQFCNLQSNALALSRNINSPPTRILLLNGAKLQKDVFISSQHHPGFSVTAMSPNSRNGLLTQTTFTFFTETEAEKDEWVSMISYVIEKLEKEVSVEVGDRAISQKKQRNYDSQVESKAFEVSNASEPAFSNRLYFSVLSANNLLNVPIKGICNPFLIVTLGDKKLQSLTPLFLASDITWNFSGTINIPYSENFQNMNLIIEVWNQDLNITNDFLGHVVVPLTTIPIMNVTGSALDLNSTDQKQLKSFPLQPRKLAEPVQGTLSLELLLVQTGSEKDHKERMTNAKRKLKFFSKSIGKLKASNEQIEKAEEKDEV